MKFSVAAFLSLFALSNAEAAASPIFNIVAALPGSPIEGSKFSAAHSSFFLKLPHQNAICQAPSDGFAQLVLDVDRLFLFNTGPERQIVFVDRSGMGQGKLGYINANQPPPPRFEVSGWRIERGELTFKGAPLLACPHGIENSWSVWVFAGNPNPGGNSGCIRFPARVLGVQKPNPCRYS